MTLQHLARALAIPFAVTYGPRFMDGVVLLGIAAAIVTAVGTALLVAYAIIAGVMRRWHR